MLQQRNNLLFFFTVDDLQSLQRYLNLDAQTYETCNSLNSNSQFLLLTLKFGQKKCNDLVAWHHFF